MTDQGEPDDAPTLAMPSFTLRRRKGGSDGPAPDVAGPDDAAPDDVGEQPSTAPDPGEARARRQLPTLALSGVRAAAATGVVIGGLAVVLAWLATSACDVVRGTSSCGGGPGLLVLLVVLALLAYAGSLLLSGFTVPEPGSTSVLAVGITAVLMLVFLLGSIDEWWMVIAVPTAAVIAYCTSWWVTDAVVGEDSEALAPESHDVR